MKKILNLLILGLITLSLLNCGGNTKKSETDDTADKGKATLSIDKKEVKPSETIIVTFEATTSDFASGAWVGIIPSNIEHGDETKNDEYDVDYQYLNDRTEGTMTFKAPMKPGKWDFRLHTSDNEGKEVASVTFTVVAPPAGNFTVGEAVSVLWSTSWYDAEVVSISDNIYTIKYYDGSEAEVTSDQIRKILKKEEIKVGDKVLAVWTTDKYYVGTVKEIKADGAIIAWEDGSTPSLVKFGKIAQF
jgi:hypothetical protein